MTGEPRAENAGPAPSATPQAPPFNCPYCGLEELRPDAGPNEWYCEACTRLFELRLLKVGR